MAHYDLLNLGKLMVYPFWEVKMNAEKIVANLIAFGNCCKACQVQIKLSKPSRFLILGLFVLSGLI